MVLCSSKTARYYVLGRAELEWMMILGTFLVCLRGNTGNQGSKLKLTLITTDFLLLH